MVFRDERKVHNDVPAVAFNSLGPTLNSIDVVLDGLSRLLAAAIVALQRLHEGQMPILTDIILHRDGLDLSEQPIAIILGGPFLVTFVRPDLGLHVVATLPPDDSVERGQVAA